MSRSGYSDECEFLDLYRANVNRAIHGKRGQKFLRDLIRALDTLPEKILISGELINADGQCCAIGAVCKQRALDISKVEYDDPDEVGKLVEISRTLAAEIAFENDDDYGYQILTPDERWRKMRNWAVKNLSQEEKNR